MSGAMTFRGCGPPGGGGPPGLWVRDGDREGVRGVVEPDRCFGGACIEVRQG